MAENNKEMVESRLLQLDQYLTLLRAEKDVSFEEFQKDILLNMAVIHLLQVGIQIIIDISSHILSRTTHEVPDEARQVFDFLSRADLITEEHAFIYKKMVQFRHLVVHLYAEVQLDRVYDIL